MIYLDLLLAFMQIGLFSIGGGYAAMPLIQHQTIDVHSWLTMSEFADIMTISEMTPGPIAINSATFVGIQVAGIPGALAATLGCILPSCFIVTFLAFIYYKARGLSSIQGILKGIRPAVIAMIASAAFSLITMALYGTRYLPSDYSSIDWIAAALFVLSLVILRKWKPNPIAVMAGCGCAGIILYMIF